MTNDGKNQSDGSACGCGGGSCCSGTAKWIWIVLIVAVAGVLIAKNAGKKEASPTTPATGMAAAATGKADQQGALPRLLDLGSTKCVPCKMMMPVLAELKNTYAGRLDVQFIDVWEDTDAGKKYGINMIPTQIFFDAAGKELFRHEGFFGKEDVLAKWKELGVEFPAPKNEAPN